MTDPLDFRALLRDGMARRGWNQKQLADAAGVANPQVYLYLSGKRDVTAATLAKLLDAIGATVKLPRARSA